MAKSLLQQFRNLHRQVASVLFVFFFIIAFTGLLLGWKSLFTETLFENAAIKPSKNSSEWLPLDSLEIAATKFLNEKANTNFKHAESVSIRLAKGAIGFVYKNGYNVQIDGNTASIIKIELKKGGIIQDFHDGAIIDEWIPNKQSIAKKAYATIMGAALLLLTITGVYLWYKPKLIKQSKQG